VAVADGETSIWSITSKNTESTVPKSRSPVTSRSFEICGRANPVCRHFAFSRYLILTTLLEYKLVAGGDELFLETNIKSEDLSDPTLITPVTYDEYSPASDRSGGSTCPSRSLYSGSSPSGCSATERTLAHLGSRVPTHDDDRRFRSPPEQPRAESRRLSPLAAACWTSDISPASSLQSCPAELYNPLSESLSTRSQLSQPSLVDSPLVFSDSSLSVDHLVSPTRLTRLSLWAEGMQPCSIPIDSLVPSTQPSSVHAVLAVALCVKLHLPPIDAPCSPGLHGFQGSITCTAQPSSTFRCSTSVFVRNQCVSQEIGFCSLVTVEPTVHNIVETASLLLPDSSLSRSRWLDSSEQLSTFNTQPSCLTRVRCSLPDSHRAKSLCKR